MHDRKNRINGWATKALIWGRTLKSVRGRRREVGRLKKEHISKRSHILT